MSVDKAGDCGSGRVASLIQLAFADEPCDTLNELWRRLVH